MLYITLNEKLHSFKNMFYITLYILCYLSVENNTKIRISKVDEVENKNVFQMRISTKLTCKKYHISAIHK